jgi:hypothetical protein
VKEKPSTYILDHVWLTTWPLGEVAGADVWEKFGFNDQLAGRIAFGSHQPFGGDSPADVEATLGEERAADILLRGGPLFSAPMKAVG